MATEFERIRFEELPKETLVRLVELYSRNWILVDGLWFQNVEDKWGLETAVELDVKMWKVNARVEARRIRDTLGIQETGLSGILKALNFMTWQPASPFWTVEEFSENKLILSLPHCPLQEARLRKGRPEFPCKEAGIVYFEGIAQVFSPEVKVRCIVAPPDPHLPDLWCKWELYVDK